MSLESGGIGKLMNRVRGTKGGNRASEERLRRFGGISEPPTATSGMRRSRAPARLSPERSRRPPAEILSPAKDLELNGGQCRARTCDLVLVRKQSAQLVGDGKR